MKPCDTPHGPALPCTTPWNNGLCLGATAWGRARLAPRPRRTDIAAMRNAMPALLRVADAAKARFEVWTPETYQELKEALEALEEAHNG